MKKLSLILMLVIITFLATGQQTIHIPGDYQSIQEGINAANNGDIVLVDEGTYVENIFFNGRKITVASRFLIDGEESHIEKTIIDGSAASGNEYASVVHFTSGEDTTSTLMGFTLINGEGYEKRMGGGILVIKSGARIVSNRIIGCKLVSSQAFGGGIYASSYEDGNDYYLIIEDNHIEGDSVFSTEGNGAFGGGIYVQTMYARIKGNVIKKCLTNGGEYCVGGGIAVYGYYKHQVVDIIENEIYSNKCDGAKNLGGGIFAYYCTTRIIDNHIYSNTVQGEENIFSFAKGGGITVERLTDGSIVSGNLIEKNKCKNKTSPNWGGGLEIYCPDTVPENLNNVFVDGNTFRKNEAYWGGAVSIWRSNVSLTNNFFDDNYAKEYGGAIHVTRNLDVEGTVRIINNTFLSNASVSSGASIWSNLTGNILLMNNIHWENLGADEITSGPASLEMYNCNIETDSINGEWEGSQNFRKDPRFESGCELAGNSPCIDRGNGNVQAFGKSFYAPLHDIQRIVRPQGGYYDVGAYEKFRSSPDTLDYDDLERLYLVHMPDGYNAKTNLPVVINLHGDQSDAQYQIDWTGMNDLADEMGFITVYPDAIELEWNASLEGNVDDVGFINALIDELQNKYSIDPDRLYVCGFSLGGTMINTLACSLSDRIAAFAVVGGELDEDVETVCEASRKMPVLVMHGTTDSTVDFTKAERVINFWNEHNNGSLIGTEDLPDKDPLDGCTVSKTTYVDDDEKCNVLLYKVNDGGHNWPDANWNEDDAGNMNRDINANLEIWNFFKEYRLSDFTSINEFGDQMVNLKSYPNPLLSATTIEYKLKNPEIVHFTIYNHLGKQVEMIEKKQSAGKHQFVWNAEGLPAGVYFCVLKTESGTQSMKMIKLK